MKTAAVLLASIAAAFILAGCDLFRYSDDIAGPATDPPPVCSVTSLLLESALVTTSRGGYADIRLTVENSRGCPPAHNVHADIIAEQGSQWVGESSVDFDFLDGGESAGATLDIPVTGLPDGAYCALSWYDDAGNTYTAISNTSWGGGLPLLAPPAGK